MKRGLSIILLFIGLCGHAQQQKWLQDRVHALSEERTDASALMLSGLWDSLYFGPSKPYMYQYLAEQEWQDGFEKRLSRGANNLGRVELSFALAAIYHTQSKFLKSKPLLEWLLTQKTYLSEKKYHLVLIKLEENYRALFQLDKALEIRTRRIELGLIKNYWALYEEYGLYELALQDFSLFEPVPAKDSYEYIRYLNIKAKLYYWANKLPEAREYFKEGLNIAHEFYANNKDLQQFPASGRYHWVGLFQLGEAMCSFKEGKISEAQSQSLHATRMLTGYYKMEGWFLLADIQLFKKNKVESKQYIDSIQTYTSIIESNLSAKLHFDQLLRDYYALVGDEIRYKDYALRAAEGELQKSNAAVGVYRKDMVKTLSELEIKERRNELKISYAIIRYQTLWIVGMIVGLILLSLLIAILVNKAKQRKKFALLTAFKNAELELKSNELAQQSEYAQWLLKELHHRVKNNLQVVSSMLNLQQRRTNIPEIASSLQSLQTRIQSIAIMHQHLYQENEGALLDMEAYIQNLITQLRTTYSELSRKIRFKIEVENCKMSISMAMPIGLIITEIVSNSMKYAFSEQETGNIYIQMYSSGDHIHLIVKDDGCGFDQAEFGEDHLGMRLINILAKQIKATVETVSDNGVQYKLTFKSAEDAGIDR